MFIYLLKKFRTHFSSTNTLLSLQNCLQYIYRDEIIYKKEDIFKKLMNCVKDKIKCKIKCER